MSPADDQLPTVERPLCGVCKRRPVPPARKGAGRPRKFCSRACTIRAADCRRRGVPIDSTWVRAVPLADNAQAAVHQLRRAVEKAIRQERWETAHLLEVALEAAVKARKSARGRRTG